MSCGLQSEWLDKPITSSLLRWKSSSHSNGKSAHSDGKPALTPMESHTYSDGKTHLTTKTPLTSQQHRLTHAL
jgi:hypothetical protein